MPTNLETLRAVLTVQQAVRALNISKNTAYALVRSGKLHSVRIGRQIRIPKDALIEFLQK